ncbi:MAG: glycosyltransferase family 2 protein [Betaproteobacteria bacterium]|nr:glycosyltransferase family 2 protein [Betaproteobacteria bacterium]
MLSEIPQFSIVMPAYNAARFIDAAVGSVRAQTCRDWELIIVNDGSTDATEAAVASWCERDPRIRLISVRNGGVSAARNHGMAAARGTYIALLDADDLWHADKLERHAQHFAGTAELGVSFTRARFMTHDGQPTANVSSAPLRGIVPAGLLYENPTTTPSTLAVRRELVAQAGGFDESMRATEDLEWLFRIVHLTRCRIEGIDAPLTLYRSGAHGASANLARMAEGWEQFLLRVRILAPCLHRHHYRAARATHMRYLARHAIRHGACREACAYIREALACDWRLVLRSPRRTLLTLATAYLQRVAALFGAPRAHQNH